MDAQQLTYEGQVTFGALEDRLALRIAKRVLDVTGGLLLLALLAPLMLAISIAVRAESRGGAVFRQRRVGRGGQPFVCNKFRTMHADADPARHRAYIRQLLAQPCGPERRPDSGLYKLAVDDRVTRIGRFLRRSSFDELPQLWNVVRGEMSLVGPRPVIEYELEHYADWYRERFVVKPGITGLWQVSGRNERTYEEMVALDVQYVRDRTFLLDLKILFKTVWVVLRRRGVA